MTLFRDNIAPSGGNNDAVRSSLINLLYFAYEVAHDNRPGMHNKLDVMDYIYHEIFEAMVSRTSIPYAPYIMMLIKGTLQNQVFDDADCEAHLIKRPYVTKAKAAPRDSFMADARSSGRSQERRTRAPSIGKEVKKLSWFQKCMLCMSVDIHKEQYHAHKERQDILHNQSVILHHI